MSSPESHHPLRAAEALRDKQFLANHMAFSQMSLEEMDDISEEPKNFDGTDYIDLSAMPQNDSNSAVVILSRFDDNVRDVYARTLANYIHGALGKRYRVVGLAHENKKEPSVKISPLDAHAALERLRKEDISSGIFSALVIPKIELLQDLGIHSAHLVGIQLGASLGASMIEVAANNPEIEIPTALLVEPPNVMNRLGSELEHLIGPATFYYPSQETVERTGIRPLREGLKEFDARVLRSMYHLHCAKKRYNILADTGTGQALLDGLGTNSFMDTLAFQNSTQVTAARAGLSRVARGFLQIVNPDGKSFQSDEISSENIEPVIVPGVGHELVYDIPTIALLAKYSISKAQPQDLVY